MEDSRKARTSAKGRFTRAVNNLSDAIRIKTWSVTVERRYQELREYWKAVQDRHDEYVYHTEESEENNTCIEELCKAFSETEILSDEYLREVNGTLNVKITKICGRVEVIDSNQYELFLADKENNIVTLEVLGIETISSDIKNVHIENVTHLFRNTTTKFDRPNHGEVDCLIGFQYAGFHPVQIKSVGHLLLLKNRFGYIIAGSHPSLIEKKQKFIKNASVHFVTGEIRELYEIESLGISSEPKCGSCRCGTCHLGGKNMTLNEEREYHEIKKQFNIYTRGEKNG